MNNDKLKGRKATVIRNFSIPGVQSRSYTHGETGVVLAVQGEQVLVKLDNTKKYEQPYRYHIDELRIDGQYDLK